MARHKGDAAPSPGPSHAAAAPPEGDWIAAVRGFATAAGRIDADIRPGEIVALRGGNGSGKTSLLRLLAGLTSPLQAQQVLLRRPDPATRDHPGRAQEAGAPQDLPAAGLQRLVQLAPQDPRDGLVGLTVQGEFRLRHRAVPSALAPLASREATAISSGETRHVALAVALGEAGTGAPAPGSPHADGPAPLCLLDEPAEGLDDAHLARLRSMLRAHAANGGAVVFADHSGALQGLATREIHLPSVPHEPLRPLPGAPTTHVVLHAPASARPSARVARVKPLPALHLSGGLHALIGPNGSGKSTMLACLAGVEGEATAVVGGRPAILGRTLRFLLPHARDALTRESVEEELSDADLAPDVRRSLVPDELLPRLPLALSGGQAQRVAICKVLGVPAPAYLLDEPEVFLDGAGRAALFKLLGQRIEEGSCILAATHDPDLIGAAATRIRLEAPA